MTLGRRHCCAMIVLNGTIAQLDGAGAVTFLLSIPALLPLYKALNMNKYLLILLLALSARRLLTWYLGRSNGGSCSCSVKSQKCQ